MGRTANDMVSTMRGWIGRNERDGSHKGIIDLYNSVQPLPRGYKVKYTDEWCDTCVSAAGIQAGCSDLIGRECGCEEHVKIFQSMGIWIEDGNITPQTGDIVLYNWDDGTQPNDGRSDHIGVVEGTSGNQITIIEGNYNERVQRRVIPVGWGYIRGYARPRYESAPAAPAPDTGQNKRPVDDVAKDVIAGKYGNGEERRQRLAAEGYNPDEVQARVNALLSGAPAPAKSVDEVAQEVIKGLWGNGVDRRNRLEAAGYDYNAVQAKVNELVSAPANLDAIAREVIAGKWGNGAERRQRLEAAGYDYNAVQARVNQMV